MQTKPLMVRHALKYNCKEIMCVDQEIWKFGRIGRPGYPSNFLVHVISLRECTLNLVKIERTALSAILLKTRLNKENINKLFIKEIKTN